MRAPPPPAPVRACAAVLRKRIRDLAAARGSKTAGNTPAPTSRQTTAPKPDPETQIAPAGTFLCFALMYFYCGPLM